MKLEIFGHNQLNFVELNTSGTNDTYEKCHPTSRYLHTNVFNLFSSCFEKSNNLYEYFGATRYNARQIVVLRNSLLSNLEQWRKCSSREDFVELISGIFLGKDFAMEIRKMDPTWDLNWETYLIKLLRINQGLIDIVTDCMDNSKILWVIGY